jgi:DNA-binding protein Fis
MLSVRQVLMSSKNTNYAGATEEYGERAEMALGTKVMLLRDLALNFLNEVHELGEVYIHNGERPFDFYREVRRFEISLIRRALRLNAGNQAQAAQLLGMNPTTLHAKIKQYGIPTRRGANFAAREPARDDDGDAADAVVVSGRARAEGARMSVEGATEEAPTVG